jgi:hypothetical protein
MLLFGFQVRWMLSPPGLSPNQVSRPTTLPLLLLVNKESTPIFGEVIASYQGERSGSPVPFYNSLRLEMSWTGIEGPPSPVALAALLRPHTMFGGCCECAERCACMEDVQARANTFVSTHVSTPF